MVSGFLAPRAIATKVPRAGRSADIVPCSERTVGERALGEAVVHRARSSGKRRVSAHPGRAMLGSMNLRAAALSGAAPVVRRALRAVAIALAAALASACGAEEPRAPVSSAAPLEPWVGEFQGLFDDTIEPAAVGLSHDGVAASESPLLALRTRQAELVARMRLQTLTRDTRDETSSYALTFEVGQPPLRAGLVEPTIELRLAEGSQAFELVSSVENTLRGRVFVGFVRRFRGEDGPELHWHMTADSADVHQAVSVAATFDELATP